MDKILFWVPRVLAIVYVAFISLFALDVFSGGLVGWDLVAGLLMHLIPTLVVLLAIIIAWRNDLWGFILFVVLGGATIFVFDTLEQPVVFWAISFPVIVIAILYLVRWLYQRRQI